MDYSIQTISVVVTYLDFLIKYDTALFHFFSLSYFLYVISAFTKFEHFGVKNHLEPINHIPLRTLPIFILDLFVLYKNVGHRAKKRICGS